MTDETAIPDLQDHTHITQEPDEVITISSDRLRQWTEKGMAKASSIAETYLGLAPCSISAIQDLLESLYRVRINKVDAKGNVLDYRNMTTLLASETSALKQMLSELISNEITIDMSQSILTGNINVIFAHRPSYHDSITIADSTGKSQNVPNVFIENRIPRIVVSHSFLSFHSDHNSIEFGCGEESLGGICAYVDKDNKHGMPAGVTRMFYDYDDPYDSQKNNICLARNDDTESGKVPEVDALIMTRQLGAEVYYDAQGNIQWIKTYYRDATSGKGVYFEHTPQVDGSVTVKPSRRNLPINGLQIPEVFISDNIVTVKKDAIKYDFPLNVSVDTIGTSVMRMLSDSFAPIIHAQV